VYYGHEKAWEYFSQRPDDVLDLSAESRPLPPRIALASG